MGRFVAGRLVAAVGVVWIVSLAAFLVFQIAPQVAGANPALLYVGQSPSPAQVAAVEANLGFDQPVVEQYLTWLGGIVSGREYSNGTENVQCPAPCLGYSFRYNQPVSDLIVARLPVTISVTLGAAVLWLVFGVGAGLIAALRPRSLWDRGLSIVAVVGVSLPVYFTGLLLLSVFSYGPSWLRWFPDVHYVPFTTNPLLWAGNLMLPWIALAFASAALYVRLTRSSVSDVLSEDYMRTAVAKGLPRRRIVGRHALRAAATPLITVLALDVGVLLGGAVLVEATFSLPGLGLLAFDAIGDQDLPVIMGVTIVSAVFIVLANLVADVVQAVVDPRVRLGAVTR